jgi:hypothetical protein
MLYPEKSGNPGRHSIFIFVIRIYFSSAAYVGTQPASYIYFCLRVRFQDPFFLNLRDPLMYRNTAEQKKPKHIKWVLIEPKRRSPVS